MSEIEKFLLLMCCCYCIADTLRNFCEWLSRRAAASAATIYRLPQVTDAEREALQWCRDNITAMAHPSSAFSHMHAKAIGSLLKRLG